MALAEALVSDLPPARRIRLAPPPHAPRPEEAPITLAVHERGEGPAVVLCHGFPELAFSWRHQLEPLARAGFRAIAPDQRGYGASDRPEATEAYDIHHLTGDMVGLLDALGLERAVFVGHDWGGFVAWAMPILHPERTAGVVGVNTPYLPRPEQQPTSLLRMLVGGVDERMYMLWFQRPGVAEPVLERDVRLLFEKLMRRGVDPSRALASAMHDGALDLNPFRRLAELETLGEPLLGEAELDRYVRSFEASGFRGPLSWYRNLDRNWETAPAVGVEKVQVPCLMICAQWDPALRPELAAGMPELVPDLEMHTLARCGHWTPQEQPEELNRLLVGWLERHFG